MEGEASDGKGTSVMGTSIKRMSMKRISMRSGSVRGGSVRCGREGWSVARAATWLGAGIVLILLSGCLPATVTPRRTVTSLPLMDAYAAAVATIDTQPYPATMGGWIITQADPSSGFVAAEMSYRTCGYVPFRFAEFRCRTHTARVSVTLVAGSRGIVFVAIGASDDTQARDLAEALAARLRVRPVGMER